jgi:hypothetical protein
MSDTPIVITNARLESISFVDPDQALPGWGVPAWELYPMPEIRPARLSLPRVDRGRVPMAAFFDEAGAWSPPRERRQPWWWRTFLTIGRLLTDRL